jgi:predicted PurR-regulated permease PerM
MRVMSDLVAVSSAPPGQRARLQRYARLILSVVLVGLGLWTLHSFLPALVWAVIIAVAIYPLYGRAARRWPPGKHNVALPLLFTTVVALVFLLPFIVLGVQAAHDAREIMSFATKAMESGIPEPGWVANLPFGSAQISGWWKDNLANASDVSGSVHHFMHGTGLLKTQQLGAAFTHRIVIFCFTILTLFFLLRNGEEVSRDMLRASLRMFGPQGEALARQIVSSIHGTVDGLVLVGLGEGVLLGIAYAVAGVPHATLLGALSAVAAMIPFMVVALVLVIGAVLLAQGSVISAIVIVAFGMIVVFVADHFVRPVLIGGATKLPFLWVLLGILGGVETWGLFGLFVGPAIMAALILLWRQFVRPESEVVVELPRPASRAPVPMAGE